MNNLCKIREIQRAVNQFELQFISKHKICLNEGMALCSLSKGTMSCGELCDALGLTPSNLSKVVTSLEKKKLINRGLGKEDKRQMFFSLSKKGEALINDIKCEEMEIPSILNPILG